MRCERDALLEQLARERNAMADLVAVVREEVGAVLEGALSRADCHLVPMVDAFCRYEAGAELLAQFPALATWWERVREEPVVVASDPGLPG